MEENLARAAPSLRSIFATDSPLVKFASRLICDVAISLRLLPLPSSLFGQKMATISRGIGVALCFARDGDTETTLIAVFIMQIQRFIVQSATKAEVVTAPFIRAPVRQSWCGQWRHRDTGGKRKHLQLEDVTWQGGKKKGQGYLAISLKTAWR